MSWQLIAGLVRLASRKSSTTWPAVIPIYLPSILTMKQDAPVTGFGNGLVLSCQKRLLHTERPSILRRARRSFDFGSRTRVSGIAQPTGRTWKGSIGPSNICRTGCSSTRRSCSGAAIPEATLHALADEILKHRRALRLLARAIGWADAGASFALVAPALTGAQGVSSMVPTSRRLRRRLRACVAV
jgi:hypothetical protein